MTKPETSTPPMVVGLDRKVSRWCEASGQYLGYGTEHNIGDVIPCEMCGKMVKLRPRFQRDFNVDPSYPRHKAAKFRDMLVAAPTLESAHSTEQKEA